MKKLRVMAVANRREELLRGLLRLGCVEISEPDDKLSDPAWSTLLRRESSNLTQTRTEIADVNAALAAIKQYAKVKEGLFIQRKPVSEEVFLDAAGREPAKAASRAIGEALQKISRLQGEETRLSARRAALLPWKSLDMPLELEGTAHTLFRLGVCPGSTDTGAVRNALGDAAAELYEVSADKQQKYYLLICHRADEEAALDALRTRGFSVTAFQGLTGTPAENLRRLEEALAENRRRQEETAAGQDAQQRDSLGPNGVVDRPTWAALRAQSHTACDSCTEEG